MILLLFLLIIERHLREVDDFFAEYDADIDGKISNVELKKALQKTWPNVTDYQVETIISQMDENDDGMVCRDEMIKSKVAENYSKG